MNSEVLKDSANVI